MRGDEVMLGMTYPPFCVFPVQASCGRKGSLGISIFLLGLPCFLVLP